MVNLIKHFQIQPAYDKLDVMYYLYWGYITEFVYGVCMIMKLSLPSNL